MVKFNYWEFVGLWVTHHDWHEGRKVDEWDVNRAWGRYLESPNDSEFKSLTSLYQDYK